MSTEAKKVEVELLVSHDVATGKTTCHDYRFNTVRELVKDPSLRVTDIAKKTGYNKGHVSRLRKESKRKWVGLTDQEVMVAAYQAGFDIHEDYENEDDPEAMHWWTPDGEACDDSLLKLRDLIEAKLKEKNT